MIELSPFEVRAEEDSGYLATSTLGGTLIRTDLADVGSAISVYTKDFMKDIGAYDNETLLAFTVNTDIGGPQGTWVNANSQGEENENFGAGHANTRIRGLTAADNTLNYFKSDAPWDGYNTDRIDVIRGANSILFGLGSPAGIINASWVRAQNRNRGEIEFRTDEHGTRRASLDYNRVLIRRQLALRIALLKNDQKFKQKPAFKDDERIYGTLNIRPKFLQSQNSTFRADVSFEHGRVTSNTRRGTPPVDLITNFFAPRSEGGLEGKIIDNSRINNLPTQQYIDYAAGNPMVSSAWGNGTVVLVYDRTALPTAIFEKEINSANGYRMSGNNALINVPTASGSSATSISGTVPPVFMNGYNAYARMKGFEFADRYTDRVLTDTSIYDFYNNLIDGNSKGELRKWNTGHADVVHSFFDNKLSYNLQYFKESMEFDRFAAMGGSSQLRIDASMYLPDGSLNPHAGKAYFRESPFTGSRHQDIERDSWRAVLFGEHDFGRNGSNWFTRNLGRHFVTATRSQQTVEQQRADYLSNGVGLDWVNTRLVNSNAIQQDQFQTRARTLNYFYVSDSLAGMKLGDNLNIQNIGPGTPPPTGQYDYRYFEAATQFFNKAVAPNAVDPVWARAAQNPNNYKGWTTGKVQLYGAPTDAESREYLTRNKDFFKEKIDSKAFAWQGKFLQGALVGTYGWREDTYKSWIYNWDEQRATKADFDQEKARFNFTPIIQDGPATNWSIVAHPTQLFPNSPIKVSLTYGKGENTSPDPSRVGVFREPVFSAKGGTEEYMVTLASRDNKWVVRFGKFETAVKNASSTSTLQSQKFLLEQTFSQSFAGVYRSMPTSEGGEAREYYGRPSDSLVAREAAGTITPAEAAKLAVQRANVATNVANARAWLSWEQEFATKFPEAVAAWKPVTGTFPNSIQTPGMGWSYPENAVLLEDNISRGYEMEITANPIKGLRLAVSASQTESIRDKLPGKRFAEVVDFIWDSFQGPVGRVAINASNTTDAAPSANNTPLERFSGLYDSYQVALQNNGQVAREFSEWTYRAIANYTIQTGRLKGVSFGGNFRYESPKVIGYGYMYNSVGKAAINLDQQYKNEALRRYGLRFGYDRKLAGKYHWRIALNIDNAFQPHDKLLANRVQPDGSLASAMIVEGRTWSMTTSLEF